MRIHACARCEGCGYVAGGFRWEVAWSRWSTGQADDDAQVLTARACPDCGGTGALIELEMNEPMPPSLPSRRGLPETNRYARHVAMVLQSQRA